MRYYLFLTLVFASFVAFSYSGLFPVFTEILGGTELNGNGCVCHSLERDYDVTVWVEGPDTLIAGQTGLYKMYMAGGPAEAGGYNVAGRFGTMSLTDTLSKWDYRSPNELVQAFPLVFPTTNDTIFWEFAYTASDSSETDTIYSVGLSLIFDGIPDSLDRWNYGPKLAITVIEDVVPVELISFSGFVHNDYVKLNWATASENNNMGFELEKSKVKSQNSKEIDWEKIGFIEGRGTTTEISYYFFEDKLTHNLNHNLRYRLKQSDHDGSFSYSNEIEIEIDNEMNFVLEQNYPNPFNPSTKIRFVIPKEVRNQKDFPSQTPRNDNTLVTLKVFDVLGREVTTLVNDYRDAGFYELGFNARGLSSGIYYYKLQAGDYSITRKMLLLK